MATHMPYSSSPRVRDTRSSQVQTGDPMTPVHSPHHSVTSSASSRTPIHTLTIHEYRKQQQTSLSQKGTPPGKTLRRKAAASALNDAERTPLISRPSRSGSGSSLRPLHWSRSAQQLNSSQPPFQQQPFADLAFRAQSAEPRVQAGSVSSLSSANSSGKVRYFNSRKRLPRPPAATGSLSFPTPLANVKSIQFHRSPLPATLPFSTADSHSSDAQATPTPSTFSTVSLSRFPRPPHLIDPSFSPPHENGRSTRTNALSYTSTAPATPPATPAIIHYRGASFDLVNPHDSLVLHDIVTPSRDFGSSDFLPLGSSEDPLIVSSEMAPKRALYGDFGAAHAGIMRRTEDSINDSTLDLPLPPTPAAISPSSSAYTSPLYSPEFFNAPSPLVIKKSANDSRFSLKQLTRSLTKKLGKSPARSDGEELQEMGDRSVSLASISMNGEYPRPLDQTYVATLEASYFPVGPISPMTPTSASYPLDSGASSPENPEVEMTRRHSDNHSHVEPLTSMVPDDPSTQLGRVAQSKLSMSEQSPSSRPYYDDLDSIYPSSSVYTGDDHRKSNYQQSLASNRQSNPFLRYSGIDVSGLANEYNRDSLYDYGTTHPRSRQTSRTFTEEMYHCSVDQGDAQTDTISKIIDRYNPDDSADQPLPGEDNYAEASRGVGSSGSGTFDDDSLIERPQTARVTSGLSQFEFELHSRDHGKSAIQPVLARRPTNSRNIGSAPLAPAPLAPAFEYDEAPFISPQPELSDMFSNGSSNSYGDTRHLLRIPRLDSAIPPLPSRVFDPSSSYSQPDLKGPEPSSSYSQKDEPQSPQTPQEALDEAEKIFHNVATVHQVQESGIPAMWAQRSSGSLLLSKKITTQSSGTAAFNEPLDTEGNETPAIEKADWETIGGDSQRVRDSLDSIADYSSSDGTRNSLGLTSEGSPPSWARQNHSQGLSLYSHPSTLRTHPHPFKSSPPDLRARGSVRTAPHTASPPLASSPPASSTVPAILFSTSPEDVFGRGAVDEPYAFAPWADPYAFSDKETQELLASGPNDDIIVEEEPTSLNHSGHTNCQYQDRNMAPSSSSPLSLFNTPVELERENTFEKLSVVGPKGNLTGTPRGTGMNETGSSVADTSSPGVRLSSSAGRESFRSDFTGFYASPFPAIGSVTRISNPPPAPEPEHERTPSQMTLFPESYGLEPVQESSPLASAKPRRPARNSTTFQRSRRLSRAAVPGQTKLRQMVLAPDGRSTISSQDTHFSRFVGGSERPSTSDTNTPLRPTQPSIDIVHSPARTVIAHQHSPHLLCPEREINPEDEASRRKLSWFILAAFCLLPPCIILFRVWGDYIMVSLTEGRLGHCTAKSKKVALIAGIAINLGVVTAIVVPIIVAHALNAL